ncbi:MAG TPA: polysaccharide deacetylase family protein [Solirubrobacteraceae bacterium]|nr:polysaccharide deacetylase family protein [Solirubrobacteraceae bacterium]
MTTRPDAAIPPARPWSPGPLRPPSRRRSAVLGGVSVAALTLVVLLALSSPPPEAPVPSRGALGASAPALRPPLRPEFTAAEASRAHRTSRSGSPNPGAQSRSALPTGCRARTARVFRFGRRGHGRVVALSFDDGPAPDTPAFLGVLEHAHVPATFFQIGRQVPGHGSLLKRILRDGDAIGDHTLTHPSLVALPPGQVRHQLVATRDLIHQASGYWPCVMRPPYGAINSKVVQIAASDSLATILWSVDPRDWSRPGTRAIEQRVLGAVRPGAIVIMHDGGGPRGQTLAALPHIISKLRRRGYRFRTVPGLLGFKTVGGAKQSARPR